MTETPELKEYAPLSPEDAARRKGIMDGFAMRIVANLQHEDGLDFRLEEDPPFGKAEPLSEEIRTAIGQSLLQMIRDTLKDKGWKVVNHVHAPLHQPDAEPKGETPEQHHARTQSLKERLAASGVERPSEVTHLPAGWTRVLEVAGDGIIARMGFPDAGRVLIRQAKEKFGTLRFYIAADGGEDFVSDIYQIARWAENATEDRCCVTGRKGMLDNAGWVLTLCPEMMALRRQDHVAFSDLIYPLLPKEPAPAGPET